MNPEVNFNNTKPSQDVNTTLPPIELVVPLKKKNTLSEVLNKPLSAKRFLKIVGIASIAGVLLVAGINVSIDIYGLFLPTKGRSLPVYHNERVSKYLLSYHYIPDNFNTAIIGTSLSANLDISHYNKSLGNYRIYNASVMGANISEIKPIAMNLVDGGVKNMIICFSPYMTKNSGSKEVAMDSKLYYGALGSKNLYETYVVGLIRHFNLLPSKFPKNQINEYGVNQYGDFFKVDNVKEKIATVLAGTKEDKLTIDPTALEELKETIHYLQQHHVNFIGYFHPVPAEVLEHKHEDYARFEKAVREIVQDDSKLINFNTTDFKAFTTDYSNYIDHGHLSVKGQKQITAFLYKKLTETNQKQ